MKIKLLPLLGYLALCAGIPITESAATPTPYTTIPCGGEGMTACSPLSDFSNSMYSNALLLLQCDKGLTVSDGNCVRTSLAHANLFEDANNWLGFAMQEQMYGIGAHQQANWVNYLGSHNSYSTFADNSNSGLAADQTLSITDQLQEGMRIIRLDPRFYSGQIRLCHNSSYGILDEADNYTNCATNGKNFPIFKVPNQTINDILSYFNESLTVSDLINLTGLAGPSSEGRLYALGMHEVATWLKNNPGEFIIIRLLGTSQLDKAQYHWIDDAINHELGNLSYQPALDGSTLSHWPSLRELRGAGKQVIVFSDTGTNATFAWSKYVMDDGYTDTSGYVYPTCENQSGVKITARQPNQWSYVGEDRSGSNFFSPGPKGTLGEGAIVDATRCGYSMINLDFLLSGPSASKASITLYKVTLGLWDYTFPNPDVRRESFIWSWGLNEFGSTGPAAMALIPYKVLKPFQKLKEYREGQWLSDPPSTKHAFACAGPTLSTGTFPDPDLPANYTWLVTQTRAAWSEGESTCQQEFGSKFHFWAPASGLENQNLYSKAISDRYLANVLKIDTDPVWLNHIAKRITTAPNSLKLTALESTTINVLGGKGGSLDVKVTGSHVKTGVSGTQIVVETVPGATPGVFNETIMIREFDPTTATYQVPLTIPVTVTVPGVTLHLKAEIPGTTGDLIAHVSLDGKDYSLPADVAVVTNSIHEINVTSPYDISTDSRLVFYAWADGGAQNKAVSVGKNDVTLTGKFIPEYLLSVTSVPSNGGSVSGAGWFDGSSTISLKATPASNYLFQQFQGNLSPTTHNPVTLHGISKPTKIEADFLLIGDLNTDGIVDKKDLVILQAVLNTKASGVADIRDLNHDGLLNALDMRILVTKCTHAQCAS